MWLRYVLATIEHWSHENNVTVRNLGSDKGDCQKWDTIYTPVFKDWDTLNSGTFWRFTIFFPAIFFTP